jgi:hypothetical protein
MTLAAAAVASLATASCTPPHPHPRAGSGPLRQISALDCPDDQGDLELKSGGTGQKTCVYRTDDGSQVTLELVALDGGSPQAALAPLEAELRTEAPAAVAQTDQPADKGWTGVSAGRDHPDGHDRVDIDLPGLHIHTHGEGAADVDAGGVHVQAHDHGPGGDNAQVLVNGGEHGQVTVNAHDGGAQIRVDQPGSGVRLSYMLASDKGGPNGYRIAAYEARGPQGGPLAVAKVLSRDRDWDGLRHDVRELLRRNVGG